MERRSQTTRIKRTQASRSRARRSPNRNSHSKPEHFTERPNPASEGLDAKSTLEILEIINREDYAVAPAVSKVLPQIEEAAELAIEAQKRGGRLVYLGAGTSGRLGVLDAAECLPTFGTDSIIAVIAGAPESIFRATEASEDDPELAVRDLRGVRFGRRDVLVGISASGRTPYVIGGLRYARRLGASTIALTSNPDAPVRRLADVSIVPVVGPEVIAGSTRMKTGSAQKMVLNMLSTAVMVRLGRVFSNLMLFVQVKNEKLRKRGTDILAHITGESSTAAARALEESGGSMPVALLMLEKNISRQEAARILRSEPSAPDVLRELMLRQK